MKKSDEAGSTLILESTGRRIKPNEGLLSIDIETGEVFEGYDAPSEEARPADEALYPERAFTQGERREIAATMIAAWARFGGSDFATVVEFEPGKVEAIQPAPQAAERRAAEAERRADDMADRVRAVADWARAFRDEESRKIVETIATFNRNRDERRRILEDALERLVVEVLAPNYERSLLDEARAAARLLAEPALFDHCEECECGHARACRNVPRDQRALACSLEAAFVRYRARALKERQQREDGSQESTKRAPINPGAAWPFPPPKS